MSTLAPPRTRPRSTFPIFLLCWLALVSDGFDLYVYGATLPGFLGPENWGVTPPQAGLVGSFALVGMLIGSLVAGMLSDRIGRRRMLAASVACFAVFMLACALAPDFAWFAVFRFLACLGIGGLLPVAVSMANEFASPARKSIVVGAVLTGPAVGTVIASFASLTLLPSAGVRPVYAIGGVSLLLIPFLLKALPESPTFLRAHGRDAEAAELAARYGLPETSATTRAISVADTASSSRRRVAALFARGYALPTVGMWALCLISLLTIFGLTTWLPQVMRDSGYGTEASIAFLLWYSLGAIVGTVVASFVGQSTSPKLVVVVGFVAAALALGAVALGLSGAALVAAVVVAGFGGLGTQNMLNDHIAQFYPGEVRATGLGWALAVGRIGAIAGPTYGALLIGSGGSITGAALAFGIPAALGAVLAIALPARRKAALPA
ncbi:MFS transporter [Leucobacter allii]|uniref:MFS transporter n=1 Tax=Leucobacter allii TaxID=2932247 RepID=A0ABY4FJ47_9MICO|nr:MFS transporter [Leucobacter allii]UOQ56708.1 MFS transporter [Leucobacter allii]